MVLTQGEKMVWAATFAQTYADLRRVSDGDATFAGVLAGASAVEGMRKCEKELRDSGDDKAQMLRAMLGDEG